MKFKEEYTKFLNEDSVPYKEFKNKTIKLIKTKFGYNFWKGINDEGKPFYNVTPQNSPKPQGGYMNAEYICKIKGVPNCFTTLNESYHIAEDESGFNVIDSRGYSLSYIWKDGNPTAKKQATDLKKLGDLIDKYNSTYRENIYITYG